MTHHRIQMLLSAYLDNELNAEERETVDRHLSTCSECREILTDFQQHDQWVADLPEPLDVWESVQEQIQNRSSGQPQTESRPIRIPFWRRFVFRPVPLGIGGLVAACLVVALISFFNPTEEFYEIPLDDYLAAHTEYTSLNPMRSNTGMDSFSIAQESNTGKTEDEFNLTQFLIDAHTGD
jgi:anti-sigma factor RsiW